MTRVRELAFGFGGLPVFGSSTGALTDQADSLVRNAVARVHKRAIHKFAHALAWRRPFSARTGSRTKRVLLVTDGNPISASQIHPFLFYQRELRARHDVELRETDVFAFEDKPAVAPAPADLVLLQIWCSRYDEARILALLHTLRARNPGAAIVFLDSFAPTDLRWAGLLDPFVDLYVKKHVLRDRSQYSQPTLGDTNLTDYYSRLYGIEQPEVHHELPAGFMQKLVIGPSFFTAERMLPWFYVSPRPLETEKHIDVHARFETNGTSWYACMRVHAKNAMQALADRKVVDGSGVSLRQYLHELSASKLCVSPFGYGEVAWRDYEAMMCGSLLIKPDMGHCETAPDLFRPFETYIPIRWDFGDLEEKVRYYLAHEDERIAICRRAHRELHDYCRERRFVPQMDRLFELV